jgi:hypothetical protein
MLQTGFIAGATKLFEIERAAWDCFKQMTGDEQSICFVLATVFGRLAKRQDGEPVAVGEGAQLNNDLGQAIRQCTDFLVGNSNEKEPSQVLSPLISAIWKAQLFATLS